MNSDEIYAVIKNVGMVSSSNDKITMLKQCDCEELRKVLYYCYNPYMTYGIKKKLAFGTGSNVFYGATWRLLDMLAQRKLTGNKAIDLVTGYTRGLSPTSAEVFKRILRKDMKMGVAVKGINKAFPGLIPTFGVMLAEDYDEKRVTFPCYAEPKIDGNRGVYRDGNFYSRSGRLYTGLDHLTRFLVSINAPALDGELKIPNLPQSESSGILRSKNDSRKNRAWFYIFDMPDFNIEYVSRRNALQRWHYISYKVQVVRGFYVKSNSSLYRLYQNCLDAEYEGLMVKTLDHLYQNKRSYDWMKMKEVKTADVLVTDIVRGQGKYTGTMGYLKCVYKGKDIRVGGGFSDEERDRIYAERYVLDKFIEVEYQEVTKDGSLRHPRFIRVRHDL